MAWSLPWPRKAAPSPAAGARAADAWERHLSTLAAQGIPEPGGALAGQRRPATQADHDALYTVAPSFADMLPW
ncbi:MAG: hypothetical protein Q7S91_05100, partial [Aquabacterium sp.]|nr:hypothetical protein [Aquabacterium sp.]